MKILAQHIKLLMVKLIICYEGSDRKSVDFIMGNTQNFQLICYKRIKKRKSELLKK